MRIHALATDYDETLAMHGRLEETTLAALKRLRDSGRKPLLVTGRNLDDLLAVCPAIDVFERVVTDNGAVLYRPETKETKLLAEPPPPQFFELLAARGCTPLDRGQVIVATREPYQTVVIEAIRELGLELQIIFNKGAVMILPSGVNKETGLRAAVAELSLSPHEVVAIGDGENDHAFLSVCECGVAVANGLPMLKQHADLVTRGAAHEGVIELIEMVLRDDLAMARALPRHDVLLGHALEGGREVRIAPRAGNVLVTGASPPERVALVSAFVERLCEAGYQLCLIDPEGAHRALKGVVHLGTRERAPTLDEATKVLENPDEQLVLTLVGLPEAERPRFLESFRARLHKLRAQTGRPHRVIVEQAERLISSSWNLEATVFVTEHEGRLPASLRDAIEVAITVGPTPGTATLTRPRAEAAPVQLAVLRPTKA